MVQVSRQKPKGKEDLSGLMAWASLARSGSSHKDWGWGIIYQGAGLMGREDEKQEQAGKRSQEAALTYNSQKAWPHPWLTDLEWLSEARKGLD